MSVHRKYQQLVTESRSARTVFISSLPASISKNPSFNEYYYGSACMLAEIIGSKQVLLEDQKTTNTESQLVLAEQQLHVTLRYVYSYLRKSGIEKSMTDDLMNQLSHVVECEKTSSYFRHRHEGALLLESH